MHTVLSTLAQQLRRAPPPFQPRRPARQPTQPAKSSKAAQPAGADANGPWPDARAGEPCPADDTLSRFILSYAPVLDRRQAVMGTRLTVHATRAVAPEHMAQLLLAISQVWPEQAGHRISLNMVGYPLVRALLRLRPARNILIEVPAAIAMEPRSRRHLRALRVNGNPLQIKDCATRHVPADVLAHFQYVMAGLSEPMRVPAATGQHRPDVVRSDIRSLNGMQAAFASGAIAITGWPMPTPVQAAHMHSMRTSSRALVIMGGLQRLRRDDPVSELEHMLSQDPTVAYKLIRFVNSAAFSLPVKVVAVRDAIAVLGQKRLTRWLVLMLATTSREFSGQHATTYAALRRGALMEELSRVSDRTAWADELYACGMFSLMDRMLGQPMRELLQAISPPPDVWDALVNQSGPYEPYLRLARAVERGPCDAVQAAAAELGIAMGKINRSVLKATAVLVDCRP